MGSLLIVLKGDPRVKPFSLPFFVVISSGEKMVQVFFNPKMFLNNDVTPEIFFFLLCDSGCTIWIY